MNENKTGCPTLNPEVKPDYQSELAKAWRLRSQERFAEASIICERIIRLENGNAEAIHLLGLLEFDCGNHNQAVELLARASAVEPERSHHQNNLGVIFQSMDRHSDAAICFRKALDLQPSYTDARSNLGLSLYQQNQLETAVQCFKQVLEIDPRNQASLANLGMVRLAQQRYADAVDIYKELLKHWPAQSSWHKNLGSAYLRTNQFDLAAQQFELASKLTPENLDYTISRSIALRAAGKLSASIDILEGIIAKDFKRSDAVANLVVALEYTCQWEKLEVLHPLLNTQTEKALIQGDLPAEDPMLNIRRCDNPAVNRDVSISYSRWASDKARKTGIRFNHRQPDEFHDRITIGYLSYDFRNHPVAHQLYPLFRLHDRDRFRVIVFSIGPDDGSLFRREIETGCDEFIELRNKGIAETVQCIHEKGIDILVDLMGHSHHNRMEILALRPAPIQVSLLGFLGTTGAEFIDYIVADNVVVPEADQSFYSEKLIRMPHCYQMNHSALIEEPYETDRTASGLPVEGFVYASFNTSYKIDRNVFDCWMRLLQRVPKSVLWLNGANSMASDRMRKRAAMLGLDPCRLIFAEKVHLERHLRRLPLADLALDTIRYNGGATTANALSVGLPVIAVLGRHWVSRMAASHLIQAGLPDLVFSSLEAYERKAVELARSPEKLNAIRKRLADATRTQGMFDPELYSRHLEKGYVTIWDRYQKGLPPDHIGISAGTKGSDDAND